MANAACGKYAYLQWVMEKLEICVFNQRKRNVTGDIYGQNNNRLQ